MNKKSTLVGKSSIALALIFALFTNLATAQLSPSLKFKSPVLYSGTAGEKGAIYKFTNVIPGVDAFVKIKSLKDGAILRNIDDSTIGYNDAWQPTVGGPGIAGKESYIKWEVAFKTTSGADYTFPTMDMSAVDIDGDNVKIREFVRVKGYSLYNVPPVTLMQLTILPAANQNDGGDTHGGESNNTNEDIEEINPDYAYMPELSGLGPVVNRLDIDTVSNDVRVNYKFLGKKSFEISTGSAVLDNGYTGAIATDRYSSLYFKYISPIATLPVTYRSFSAVANDKTANLYWIIETESGNDHFEVERSFNQVNFRTIGIVLDAQTKSASGSQYSYKDASTDLLAHNIVYYRLKQVDIDGKFTYSEVKTVRFSSTPKAFVQVSPNPYMDKLNISFISDNDAKAEIRLVSLNGQLTAVKKANVNKGYNTVQLLNLSSIASGIYIVDILIDGKVIDKQKVVKQ